MITTVEQLIDQLGGTARAAEFFEVTSPAVSNWKSSGRLPAWVLPRVMAWATENETTLADSLIETSKPVGARKRIEDTQAAE